MRILIAVFVLFLGLFVLSGCSLDSAAYKKEAEAFCGVYDPDSWSDFPKDATIDDFNVELSNRIHAAISTDEFRAIFEGISERYIPDTDAYIRAEISALIGDEWDCPHFKGIYAVQGITGSPDRLTRGAGGEVPPSSEVMIRIDGTGEVSINGIALYTQDSASIADLLDAQMKTGAESVLITVPEGIADSKIRPVLDAAASLGIRKISMIQE